MNIFIDKLISSSFALLLVISLLAGCHNTDVVSAEDNDFEPIVLTTEQEAMVETGNQFAFHLLRSIYQNLDESFIASPLSLECILGMLLNGGAPEVIEEITTILGFDKNDIAGVNQYLGRMILELPSKDKLTKVLSSRALYYRTGLTLKSTYEETISTYYPAQVEEASFAKPSLLRERINNWCTKETNGMIVEILTPADDNMLADAVVALLDALWFKGIWKTPFDKSKSEKELFHGVDDHNRKIVFMKMKTNTLGLFQSSKYSSLDMPFGNGAYSMRIILPNKGESLQGILNESELSLLTTIHHEPAMVDVWIPRFEMETMLDCNKVLKDLGMEKSFGINAFTEMLEQDFTLKFIRQKASIKIDETGTEAAAVTIATGSFIAPPPLPQPVEFHADHPFIYLIAEKSTGAILFAGIYQ